MASQELERSQVLPSKPEGGKLGPTLSGGFAVTSIPWATRIGTARDPAVFESRERPLF